LFLDLFLLPLEFRLLLSQLLRSLGFRIPRPFGFPRFSIGPLPFT
jgi:hypothetical protein